MEILKIQDNYNEVIKKTVDVLKDGGLVIFPSDTVYILAVDPTNKKAVEKLLDFKNRPTGKPISVSVLNIEMAEEYVELSENGKNIYSNLLPGPFTIVSKGKNKTEKGIESEIGTLGVRIPDNKWISDLIKEFGKPVTATSANLAGENPHYSIETFLKSISLRKEKMIDLIVDAGKLAFNKPSTVIDTTESEIKILRRGDLMTGDTKTLVSNSEEETGKVAEFLLKRILNPSKSPFDKGDFKNSKPIILALSGDLGCGKTVFSRKIGEILGVDEKITSPTFFIYNEYKIQHTKTSLDGRNQTLRPADTSLNREAIKKFLHFDIYKINNTYELEEIKFLELFEENSLSCIEWPENIGEDYMEKLKKNTNYFTILFEYIDQNSRKISFSEKL